MKWAALVLVALFGGAATAATSPQREIKGVQAEALVLAALSPQQRKLPGLEAVQDDSRGSARFLFFTAIWAGPENGSVVVGGYAVDPRTGDVFSSARECYEEKNGRLAALQARVRADLQLSPSDYRRIKTKGPLCGA